MVSLGLDYLVSVHGFERSKKGEDVVMYTVPSIHESNDSFSVIRGSGSTITLCDGLKRTCKPSTQGVDEVLENSVLIAADQAGFFRSMPACARLLYHVDAQICHSVRLLSYLTLPMIKYWHCY